MAVADVQTGRILAYAHINRDDMSNSRGGAWDCIDIRKGPCIQYQSSFPDTKIELPPNPWRRLIAWGAYELRGLGELDFAKVVERESSVFVSGQFDDK